VDFAKTVYLSKFYEAIEEIDGVDYVTITEFRREGQSEEVESKGKIVLESYEVSRIPGGLPEDADSDADYGNGLKVVIVEGGI
jgi:hypothetical protein